MTKAIAATLAALLAVAVAGQPHAEELAGPASAPTASPELVLPASVDACLDLAEQVLIHALDADLLDDQIDEAEAGLERMEAACHDKKFSEALDEAKSVVALVSTNK